MGHCCSKDVSASVIKDATSVLPEGGSTAHHPPKSPLPAPTPSGDGTLSNKSTPSCSFSTGSPCQSPYSAELAPSLATAPQKKFKWPFPPPPPAKPIMSAILKRQGPSKPTEGPTPEDDRREGGSNLDKSFGYPMNFAAKYELGKEVGRGHFGHTCWAKGKKGELKNQPVAVKTISKDKMTTALSIEDVRREVKILKALSGHKSMIKFYNAFEDSNCV